MHVLYLLIKKRAAILDMKSVQCASEFVRYVLGESLDAYIHDDMLHSSYMLRSAFFTRFLPHCAKSSMCPLNIFDCNGASLLYSYNTAFVGFSVRELFLVFVAPARIG